jgi:hypothetical protein
MADELFKLRPFIQYFVGVGDGISERKVCYNKRDCHLVSLKPRRFASLVLFATAPVVRALLMHTNFCIDTSRQQPTFILLIPHEMDSHVEEFAKYSNLYWE